MSFLSEGTSSDSALTESFHSLQHIVTLFGHSGNGQLPFSPAGRNVCSFHLSPVVGNASAGSPGGASGRATSSTDTAD